MELSVVLRLAARGLDIGFDVAAGEVLAVLGPNGAGKSTAAQVVAGLLSADEAVVRVGDRTLTDTARGVHVAPWDRRVSLLLQDPLLFPHLDALGNVAFAARRRQRRTPARAAARRWLDELGVADLAGRRPRELSGGQAQRVAIARALAAEPDVLLLDEPLAGLDVAAAAAVRTVLRTVMTDTGRPTVLITHDLLDVHGLADRVLVLQDGAVAEDGPVTEVLAAPRSAFAARLAGVNLVPGVLSAPGVLTDSEGQNWFGTPDPGLGVGQRAVAVFRPAEVAVYRDRPHGSPRPCVRRRIAGLESAATAVRVRADVDACPAGVAADVTAAAVAELGLAPGQWVWLSVKAQAVGLHPASRAAASMPDTIG